MNRSVKSLLSVSVLAPVAALTVAAAPASAAPGPSTTLLYESYAAAAPVARTLPEPVTQTAGQTAELTTLTVDSALGSASRADGRSAAKALPVPAGGAGEALGGAGDLPGTALGSLDGVGAGVGNSKLGGLPGAQALPGARHTQAPLSMPLADVPSTLADAEPAGLPVGTTLFPPTGRSAQPGPADDVLGQANGAVNQVGTALDETENGVGQTVEVLKARDRVGGADEGPVSLLNSAGLELPSAPGLG
ncbi:hypothetical protein [Actinomadura sp. 7K507]|uniref:hypothetical protein n=1 Tax=Actinomadura sp. 7K507 TaxID=2530365 RepID=UPI00105383D2|nr:hypothetical protein [Actinomadura sp. 7K507]TDC84733.1 hypothetical protein E1285_26230 [Actinomadura sp. 7K507]